MNIFTPSDIKRRFPQALERTYEAGQVIIYHEDSPNLVRFIKSGAVKFYDSDADGREKIMHIGGEGSIFPLFYSFEGKDKVNGFYATIMKTEVIAVPLDAFQQELRNSPDYAFNVLRWYAGEMDHIVLRLKSMEKSNAKKRILQALYYLGGQHASQVGSRSKWHRLHFPLTQQTLADVTGLTRETVNATLRDPQLRRLVRSKGQIFEIDRDRIESEIG